MAAGLAISVGAAPPPAGASGGLALIDSERTTLAARAAVLRTCVIEQPRRRLPGVDRAAYTAPLDGFLTIRSAAAARGDWDLAAYDATSGRLLGASQGWGSREVVQAYVTTGQRVLVAGCRRSGRARRLEVSIQLVEAQAPTARRPVMLVRVRLAARSEFERLEATGVDVTHNVGADYADALVTPSQAAQLRRQGFAFTVRVADMDRMYVRSRVEDLRSRRSNRAATPTGRTTYRNYEDYGAELKQLADQNPNLVAPMQLPRRSFQGRELQGVEIAHDVRGNDGRPTFLLVALHHAREWPSAEAAIEFAHLLAQGYNANDPRIVALLRRVRVVVVPLINPDGFISTRLTSLADPFAYLAELDLDPRLPALIAGRLSTVPAIAPPGGLLSYRRKNCGGGVPSGLAPCELQWGIDPNRNYGQFWGGAGSSSEPTAQSYRGPGPWSEPETAAVHEFSQSRPITTLITLHNVAALVLRPPGTAADGKAPDEARLKLLGDAMGAAADYTSQYGFQLYDTSGTTEDWNYAAAGTFGYTIEIGPPNGGFHMPYQIGFIDEWAGNCRRPSPVALLDVGPRNPPPANCPQKGKGLREALLLAAENAGDTTDHSVIAGRAPAGATLRLRKDFVTQTRATCRLGYEFQPLANPPTRVCAPNNSIPVMAIADSLEYRTTVPATGAYEWHVTPSTRPFLAKAGATESWRLTCERGGRVLEQHRVVVARGQRVTRDLACGS